MMIKTWTPDMSIVESMNIAYWERNVLALHYADGWYNDDVFDVAFALASGSDGEQAPRYPGWRRVLSLENGAITFHIPDEFDVGTLPETKPNWDGHTTEEKWARMLERRGVETK